MCHFRIVRFFRALGLGAWLALVPAPYAAAQDAWVTTYADHGEMLYNQGTPGFVEQQAPNGSSDFDGVDFINSQVGWAVGTGYQFDGVIAKTTDGQNWTMKDDGVAATVVWHDVDFLNHTQGWAVGTNGRIIHSTDGGENWTPQTSTVSGSLLGVDFVSSSYGFVAGDDSVVLSTSNGGATWDPISPALTFTSYSAVDFLSPSVGWAVGASYNNGWMGIISKTTDGGDNWSHQFVSQTSSVRDVHFVSSLEGWAVGTKGTILHTIDGGASWSVSQIGDGFTTLAALDFRNTFEGFIVGYQLDTDADFAMHTVNGGASWSTETITLANGSIEDVSVVTSGSKSLPPGSNQTEEFGGGASSVGGVSMTFAEVTGIGTVQAEGITFALLTPQAQSDFLGVEGYDLAGSTPQLWNLGFDGEFTGGATVMFGYDPAPLAEAGVNPEDLKVLKRDDATGEIQVLTPTVVDSVNHTLTVDVDSFSTFGLAASAVPEPSSLLLGAFAVMFLLPPCCVRRRRGLAIR